MQVPMVRFSDGDSFLHRLVPLTKAFLLALLVVSIFLFGHWIFTCSAALALVLVHLASGLGFGRLKRILRPLPVFVLLIAAAHVLLVRETGSPLKDAVLGLHQGLRVIVLMTAMGIFIAVTDPLDLSDSILGLLRIFRLNGRKAGELALVVMIVFSFLPLVADEAGRIRNAQLVRCGRRRGRLAGARDVVPLVAPLVIGALRRSEELELSLAARCYTVEGGRRAGVCPGWRIGDCVLCAAAGIAFVIGLYAKF